MKANRFCLCLIYLLSAFLLLMPTASLAGGDGARVYWKSLAGSNAVTFWPILASGNANPLDPASNATPNADFDATMALLGFHKVLPLFGRTATLSIFLPVGNLEGEFSGVLASHQRSASGFGDPLLQLNVNLIGAPAMMGLADFARYEPRFTLDVLGTVALPIGEYDSDRALNIGQNRWYGRIGFPMMVTFGPWVPGKRTTFELLPAVWFFSDNDDAFNLKSGVSGQTLKNDPLFQLEAHITRDITETLWGSIDGLWLKGAKSEIGGVSGKELDSVGVGLTLGFQVTDNFSIAASYMSTVNDSGKDDLRANEFRLMLTYGWHPLVEGMKRLKGH
ncbi:MAG: transporter [Nitrospirota bacterium]